MKALRKGRLHFFRRGGLMEPSDALKRYGIPAELVKDFQSWHIKPEGLDEPDSEGDGVQALLLQAGFSRGEAKLYARSLREGGLAARFVSPCWRAGGKKRFGQFARRKDSLHF